jgi:glycerol-3-phosphate dehydrogenase (NAD(P)+)
VLILLCGCDDDVEAPMSETICVLGAGSFGTALAKVLAEGGHAVRIVARDQVVVDSIVNDHRHPRRLKGVRLPPGLHATTSLAEGIAGAGLIVSSIPTVAVREVWAQARPFVDDNAVIMSATKGIENGSLKLVSDILVESVPAKNVSRLCYLSGPSFAIEMARRLPTAVTIAAHDEAVAHKAQQIISTDYFRAYTSTDVQGVELGGALKNVVAIAAGAACGLGFGQNTLAALITRGLAEIGRLAVKLGALPVTLQGLAGMGDLVLTCTSPTSRNYTVGLQIGQGKKLEAILKELGEVAEGVTTARAVRDLGVREGVEMPIADAVNRLLFEGTDPRDEVSALMGRRLKAEAH